MQIEVVNVSAEEQVGTYKQYEIVYKDGGPGVKSKKLVSFSNPEVYNKLKSAVKGQTFDIVTEKNGKYVNWIGATPSNAAPPAVATPPAAAAPKGNWETAEEREWNRARIIRQSALNYAVALVGPKGDIEKAFEYAARFELWVNRKSSPEGIQALIEMPDDIIE